MLLRDLPLAEETPARTPWWVLLMRIAAAALLILGLARPVLGPGGTASGEGTLLLVLDDGWASGPDWPLRVAIAQSELDRAARENRLAALLTTAPGEGAAPPRVIGPMPAADLAPRLAALRPRSWPPDRQAALAALENWGRAERFSALYLSDGIAHRSDDTAEAFLARLAAGGALTLARAEERPVRLLAPPRTEGDRLMLTLRQSPVTAAGEAQVIARAQDGRALSRAVFQLGAGATEAEAVLELPTEIRNRVYRLDLADEAGPGGVVLLDERFRRRPVGLLPGAEETAADAPLIGDLFYLERALNPFAELRRGDVERLMARPLAVLILADRPVAEGPEMAALTRFVDRGGMLIRFAGARLAEHPDALLPVQLRAERQLGGSLSWEQPQHLAPFAEGSPFAGLPVPAEISVERQVLAEPSARLADRVWARLTDGTPLVTAETRGQGRIVLFHVTATAEWSDLPLSGLFVSMLRRLVALSSGVPGQEGEGALAPLEALDGFGRLVPPPPGAQPIPASGEAVPSARHPPGWYGTSGGEGFRRALNLGDTLPAPRLHANPPAGTTLRTIASIPPERDLGPWLMAAALVILALDLLVSLRLRGLLSLARAAGLALVVMAGAAQAQTTPQGAADNLPGVVTRLGYVTTGDSAVDETMRQGLLGLSDFVNRRTAAALAEPAGVTPGRDDLSLYPLLYFTVRPDAPTLSPDAVVALNGFMRNGGIILFDTRDEGSGEGFSPGARAALRRVTQGLAIPPLMPVPEEHVLRRAFYLLAELPGRFAGGTVWVSREQDRANDSVSPVVIGGHDWAGAWAVDARGQNLHAAVPGGARQRILAYRFGANLVMYALTGNYKGDQVHVPAILERLGKLMRTAFGFDFAPILPLWLIGGLGLLCLLVLVPALLRGARGAWWRAAAFLLVLGALSQPRLVEQTRETRPDIALLLVDRSDSTRVSADHATAIEAARRQIEARLGRLRDVELRVVDIPEGGNQGTRAFAAMEQALADIPAARLAGVLLLSDGQVHDVPADGAGWPAADGVPLHLLMPGRQGEVDRRIRLLEAPGFGIVGRSVELRLIVEDLGVPSQAGQAQLTLRRDGQAPITESVPIGREHRITLPIERAGPSVIDLVAETRPGEVSDVNNRVVVAINGVRDRLRVLLVSGEPHAGERTWRRLLKADPGVDLVHFTILRPPEKDDLTPLNELALIAFPVRELFQVKLRDFDLVVFDRFANRGILPPSYLRNIAEYVRGGGALLVSVGPEFVGSTSLASTPLGAVLPARPLGAQAILDQAFRPRVSGAGARHPVTEGLTGTNTETAEASWGRWYRTIRSEARAGTTVMEGPGGAPLLVLDRVGQGRVALMLSDHIWLWSRGHDGGGPQQELLRRTAHWLMREPELEEEDLTARIEAGRLFVNRRSLDAGAPPEVTITAPDGTTSRMPLANGGGGRASTEVPAAAPGLWQVSDGRRQAFAAAMPANPPEFADLRADPTRVQPLISATGGAARWFGDGANVPEIRSVSAGRDAQGSGWIGLRRREDHTVTGIAALPLLPPWLMLPLLLGVAILAWRSEAR